MPTSPDFDADLIVADAFVNFRAAPLSASGHTASGVRRTVYLRRRVRRAVTVAAAAILVAVPVTIYGLAARPTAGPEPAGPSLTNGPSVSPTVTLVAPTMPRSGINPALCPPFCPSNPSGAVDPQLPSLLTAPPPSVPKASGAKSLAVTSTTMSVNESVNPTLGIVNIMVFNHGLSGLGQMDLTFQLEPGVRPGGPQWTGCSAADAQSRVTCTEEAPAVGTAAVFSFIFGLYTGGWRSPTVTVEPRGATDVDQSDNTSVIPICAKDWCPPGPVTDLSITAGRLVTAGPAGPDGRVSGTIQVTVQDHGPAAIYEIDVWFLISDAARPLSGGSSGCGTDTFHSYVWCHLPAPLPGGSGVYTFQFSIDPRLSTAGMKVQAAAYEARETTPADNVADIVTCVYPC